MSVEIGKRVLAQFKSEEESLVGAPLDLPFDVTEGSLGDLCNALLGNEEPTPYEFYVHEREVRGTLSDTLAKLQDHDPEKLLEITYQPQARFKVQAVTRCSSSIPGHTDSVLAVQFSPDGRQLASGSGDKTIRFWDVTMETALHTCHAHKHWVMFIAWSPDGRKLASGCKLGQVCVWDPVSGRQLGHNLSGHKQWITWLSWQPLHIDPECRLLASASKDSTVRVWDTILSKAVLVLSGHTHGVTCVQWGGEGLLYTASQDRTIKVWRAQDDNLPTKDTLLDTFLVPLRRGPLINRFGWSQSVLSKEGALCRTLQGHGHWVNTMALSTNYALRTGAFDPSDPILQRTGTRGLSLNELQEKALVRYNSIKGQEAERLVSGSDDFTLFLWQPSENKKPVARMTGHQQLINQVCFSPDARLIASASFDKSVKLWEAKTGKFLSSLRGHVSRVHQISWSSDSRLLCSGSSDSTLKVWSVRQKKLLLDLPGHADEVFAVDWSPDGEKVASGGRDKVMKIWRR